MSDDAAPPPALVPAVAENLPSLRAGQRIVVGRDGRVVSGKANRRRLYALAALNVAVVGVVVVAQPVIGGAVALVGGAAVAFSVRWQRQLREALRLINARDLDGAEAVLSAASLPLLRRRRARANLVQLRSVIAERRGQLEVAIGHADECARLLPTPARGFTILYWQNQYNRCRWLLEMGRADDARAALARCGRAPGGEWYALQYRGLVLHAAMRGLADVPAEATLDAWLRDALRYNHTGALLALIGWALDRHGDAAGAEHAFAEAGSRFLTGTELFARTLPTLWAALGPRLEAAQRAADEAAAAAEAP